MLHATSTPNHAGIELLGDFLDFEALYEAFHTVVGEEGEYKNYDGGRLRVLGVCYDLRHALMGDRDVEFVQNGLDPDRMLRMGVIAQEKNLYYKIQVYWPEVLFVLMVLNDFVWMHAQKVYKEKFTPLADKRALWDPTVAQVRMFQSAIAKCLKDTVSGPAYARCINQISSGFPRLDGYITQYVDVLNIRFLHLSADKREQSITTMGKRLAEQGPEYQRLKRDVLSAAEHHHCSVDAIEVGEDYPEDVIW